MTTVSIVPESLSLGEAKYRAVAGRRQSFGKTPGEALDALSIQFDEHESATLLVIQQMKPDRFFGENERNRLSELMNCWRAARDSGTPFPEADQRELDLLTEAELQASTRRAAALLNELQP